MYSRLGWGGGVVSVAGVKCNRIQVGASAGLHPACMYHLNAVRGRAQIIWSFSSK